MIGFTSFGGMSMIPLINDQMLSHGWMTSQEVADIVAIAEMTPGPLGLNCATFAGARTAGMLGALSATLGVIFPSLTVTVLAAMFLKKFKESKLMDEALYGIATGAAKPTTDQRKLMMAEYCTQVVVNTPYFKEGFSYQTGVGGASIASTISLTKIMEERGIKMGFGVGGLTKPMCDLLDRGMVRVLMDTQAFDLDAVSNVINPAHHRITAGAYANPFNKGAFVNKLDYVILASLEVDVHFNCNVVVGSDGVITGAQGGHPDTAQGAKCTIVICPLLQGRIPAICTDVTTVTTPGESVDIVVTDYGVAVNPNRHDLLEALRKADCVPLKTIEELRDIAYSIVGEPEPVQFEDRIVGIIEARDGTIMDVVRQVKHYD